MDFFIKMECETGRFWGYFNFIELVGIKALVLKDPRCNYGFKETVQCLYILVSCDFSNKYNIDKENRINAPGLIL